MSIANDKIVNLQDAKVLYDDLRGRIKDNSVAKVLDTPADIQSFSDAARFPMELKVGIDPVQDLHGYDHPWPGGGGKNLFQRTMGNASGSGIQYTYNDDGSIVVTGTATANTSNNIGTFTAKAGVTYILTGTPTSIADNEVFVRFHGPGATEYTFNLMADKYHEYQREIQFDTDTTGYVDVRIGNGKTVNNLVFQPMIRLATETDSTFAPYENVCPISGWDGTKITVTGKNLINPAEFANAAVENNGTFTPWSRRVRTGYIRILPGVDYIASCETGKAVHCIHFYDIYKNSIGINVNTFPVTSPQNAAYAVVAFRKGDGSEDISTSELTNAQLEHGTTATTYEPFGSVYPIAFPTSSGTVYGGNLTIHSDGSGELVVDRAFFEFDGSEDENIAIGQYGGSNKYVSFSLPGDIYKNRIEASSISNAYLEKEISGANTNIGFSVYNHRQIRCRYELDNSITSEIARAYFASNPIQFVVPLLDNNVTSYVLTPGQVFALLGQNNIWADCGQINYVEYVRDTVGEVIPNCFDGIDKELHTYEKSITDSSTIKSFDDGANWPMGLNVAVDPVQDLHGYDHPWIGGAGKNKCPTATDGTYNGIVLTNNSDGSIKLTGTNGSSATYIDLFPGTFDSTAFAGYVFSYGSYSGNTSSVQIRISGSDRAALQNHNSGETTIANNGTGLYLSIRIAASYAIPSGGITLYPMLRASTATSDWEPYSNICPITGWDRANVTVTGKNLCTTLENGSVSTTDGEDSDYSVTKRLRTGWIRVKGNTQYTISGTGSNITPQIYVMLIPGLHAGTVISADGWRDLPYTLLTDANTKYIRISFRGSGNPEITPASISNAQIEEGTIATAYEPISTTYPITFPTSAGTVYGGTLSVNKDGTGELVVDRASLTIPTIESYDGTISQTTFKYVSITPQPSQKLSAEEIVATSDVLQGIQHVNRRTKAFCCYGMKSSQQIIVSVDENYSVADFNSNIAGNKIVYILNETQSYALSAPQVLSLIGQNHVWADCGDILSLTYNSKQGMEFIREDTAGQINTVVNPVKTELADAEAAMAIVVDGDTAPKNITKGQYLFVKNHSTLATGLYHATVTIASGASITSSNVEADADGGFNTMVPQRLTITRVENDYCPVEATNRITAYKIGRLLIIRGNLSVAGNNAVIPDRTTIATIDGWHGVTDLLLTVPGQSDGSKVLIAYITNGGYINISSTTTIPTTFFRFSGCIPSLD